MRLMLVMASLSSWVLGCKPGASASRPIAIEVVVESDPGRPLPGVPVYVGTDALGVSAKDGAVHAIRFDPPGTVLRFRCDCPSGYRDRQVTKLWRVRDYLASDSTGRLQLRVRCRPESRLAVFVVRVRNAPAVDVFLRGEWVARTSSDGVAHFSRRVAAGSEQVVELHAGSDPSLIPKQTSHFFQMPDADEIFVVDQTFEVRRKARRPRSRPRIIKIE